MQKELICYHFCTHPQTQSALLNTYRAIKIKTLQSGWNCLAIIISRDCSVMTGDIMHSECALLTLSFDNILLTSQIKKIQAGSHGKIIFRRRIFTAGQAPLLKPPKLEHSCPIGTALGSIISTDCFHIMLFSAVKNSLCSCHMRF